MLAVNTYDSIVYINPNHVVSIAYNTFAGEVYIHLVAGPSVVVVSKDPKARAADIANKMREIL